MTGRGEIETWFREGQALRAGFMLVVCDTFSYEDYPVYHPHPRHPGATPGELVSIYNRESMQRVDEVYDLGVDFQEQACEVRTWRLPPPPREMTAVDVTGREVER